MFTSNPPPSTGNADQFTDGGGPAFIPNFFVGPTGAEREAAAIRTFDGQAHIGHVSALQRSSRAPNTKAIHIRADGPGFDALDVPDGSQQPKLHFSIFVPTAAFFASMRRNQASLDLAQQYGVRAENLGAGALHHRDAAAELPRASAPAPRLPAARAGLRADHARFGRSSAPDLPARARVGAVPGLHWR